MRKKSSTGSARPTQLQDRGDKIDSRWTESETGIEEPKRTLLEAKSARPKQPELCGDAHDSVFARLKASTANPKWPKDCESKRRPGFTGSAAGKTEPGLQPPDTEGAKSIQPRLLGAGKKSRCDKFETSRNNPILQRLLASASGPSVVTSIAGSEETKPTRGMPDAGIMKSGQTALLDDVGKAM